MKRLVMLIVTITVGASSTTVINIPDGSWLAVVPKETICPEVGCSTATPTAVAVSTGPFILKATSGDCYRVPYLNPNGSCGPTTYMTCP